MMKFTISKADMEYGVGLVTGAIDKKRLGEYTGSILVRATCNGDRVDLHATDMELWASVSLGGVVETTGAIVLPADKIGAAIKVCGSGEVALSMGGDLKTVLDGTLASYEIAGLDPEGYPVGYAHDEQQDLLFTLHAGKMPACIASVGHAAGNDFSKPNTYGINFAISEAGRLTVTATDGHRLSIAAMDLPGECILDKFKAHNFTLPNKAAALLAKVNQSLSIGRVAKKSRLYFQSESIAICSAEGTRTYPDVRRVVPTGSGDVITTDTAQFIEALESCCVMADDQYRSVHLDISDEKIRISALGVNNTARASVQCLCDCDIKLRLNSRYLIQALKSLDSSEVFLKYFGPTLPLMIIPADHKSWDERIEIIMMLGIE